ncbi:MAG TPA: HAMP domain-containing sensor histidine kinase [Candidatus Limnocylindria bacterium]
MSGRAANAGDSRLLQAVRWRLVAWSAGSTLFLLLVLGGAIYLGVQRSLAASGVAQLERQADSLQHFITAPSGGDPGGGPGGGPDDDSPFGRPIFGGPGSGTLAIVVDEDGELVGQEPHESDGLPDAAGVDAALAEGSRDIRDAIVNGSPARVLSESVEADGERYVIQVAQDRSAEERVLTTTLIVLAIGGLVVLATATAFGFAYAGRALVPIRDSLRRQREFAADASHELRTPLTVVRGSVEDLRRHADRPVSEVGDALDDIEAEVAHLSTLVDDLLLLARTDSGSIELRRDPVELAEVAGEAVQALAPGADARGITLRLDGEPGTVRGDQQRLRQLVTILVDNALRHVPSGGSVTVAVRPGAASTLVVEDDGPGIRDEDLPHLFDRFWRANDAPDGGTGLGLAIARWIAEHHGGRISAANRADARGARFVVSLPAV